MDNIRENWSVKMADSVIARRKGFFDKWSYDYCLVLKGIEGVYDKTGDDKYFKYIQRTMDFCVNDDGTIFKYRKDKYNIDFINGGRNILFMYKKTGEEKYKKAADLLRQQLSEHPRTSEGAFWHKKIYPHQIWLDGLYMGSPFYATYIKEIEKSDNFDDVVKQFFVCFERTYVKEDGLLAHAYDESKSQYWCDKETGLSHHYWGRSIGWYIMAVIDLLDYLPENHKDRARLIEILNTVIEGMMRYIDKEANVWYQIVNMQDRKGNYKEASVSSMMVYGLARGVQMGYLDKEKYTEIAKKCYDGVIEEFVTVQNGLVNLNKICEVGGLAGDVSENEQNYYTYAKTKRDGSFEYYISEPIVTNDPKGVGAFILAAKAIEDLFS